MRIAPLGALFFLLLGSSTFAQEKPVQTFPYEAVVHAQNEDVYVRSGPSRKYYPTGKLQAGDRVSVHRHDPGGWYMIAPPEGSFSWIPARYVEQTGNQTGKVTENNVVVRVGSFQSDIRDVVQRRLSQGDTVQILGEKLLESEKGQEKWYQIVPPVAEYRWIMGQHVTPEGQVPIAKNGVQRPAEPSPFAPETESVAAREHTTNKTVVESSENGMVGSGPAVARTGPSAEEIAAYREHLESLDNHFRNILKESADQWQFNEIEQAYLEFQRQVPVPALQSQVDLRLATIDEYRFVQQDYLEFIKLTKQTNQRESQLLSIQGGQRPEATNVSTTPSQPSPVAPQNNIPAGPVPDPVSIGPQPPLATNPLTGPQAPAPRPAQPRPPTPERPSPQQPVAPPAAPQERPRQFQFDGAGIVQRLPNGPGGLNYVLVAPNGRVLAFLRPPAGLDMERYVGQSMGINGPRVYVPNLRADLLTVERMSPVRLAP